MRLQALLPAFSGANLAVTSPPESRSKITLGNPSKPIPPTYKTRRNFYHPDMLKTGRRKIRIRLSFLLFLC